MENMEQYWVDYYTETTTDDSTSWYTTDSLQYCYPYYCYAPENKTEKAFKLLKVLVEEKIIPEPRSFKKFCELIEKFAKVL